MKNLKKISLLVVLAVTLGINASNAQIFVKIRPERPHYVKVVAPSPRHVWIDEEWEPRGGAYVFVGGHWAEPPRPRAVWIPGHWRTTPRGDVWVPGHWR